MMPWRNRKLDNHRRDSWDSLQSIWLDKWKKKKKNIEIKQNIILDH